MKLGVKLPRVLIASYINFYQTTECIEQSLGFERIHTASLTDVLRSRSVCLLLSLQSRSEDWIKGVGHA